MIAFASASPCLLPPDEPGGFCWWYLDLVDARGDGVVLIWGFALPFLEPAAEEPAAAAPFLNLCAYQGGTCTYYHLEQLDPAEVHLEGNTWRFGRSTLLSAPVGSPSVFGGKAGEGGPRGWEVRASLDLGVPGSTDRVRARVEAEGAAVHGGPDERGPHQWSPLTAAADGWANIEREGAVLLDLRGRAYHDHNVGTAPLGSFGIREWAWGRVALPDADLVHYVCWPASSPVAPRSMCMRIGRDGRVEAGEGPVVESASGATRWGVRLPDEVAVADHAFTRAAIVDSAPFYARFSLRCGDAYGWGERVRPGAIGLPWMRPLVRMRVTGPDPSMWLPLFSGPRGDRLSRTVASWVG